MGIKTVIIKPGEKIILPKGVKVTSLILDGAINVESTCDDLPDPEALLCYYFQWENEGDNVGSDAWELANLDKITVDSQEYILNIDSYLTNIPGNYTTVNNLVDDIPGLFNVASELAESVGDMRKWRIHFKTIPSIASKLYLHATTDNGTIVLIPPTAYTCP